ncbi:F-box/LRR-repeat protein 10 [Selaginella moellendorffii]|uniref:F-box/LRR-repeat protein 10 n=1 Tax=Selaginella moellendorffii TaxID=88036 RepID=UPI000D1CD7D8|nr:F-box/LRR-repeat protein 10 [Selaginella moellendorffii]|eukprot:XP_024528070.1 F-box/LRR-repeat protein 10 [Selaginella moellendorffii]
MERLPLSVLQDIVSLLDLSSLFAAASTCRVLKAAVDQELPFLENLHLEDYSLDRATLKRLLTSSIGSSSSRLSLKLRGVALEDDMVDLIAKPQLEELHLEYCTEFSPGFFHDIGLTARNLRRLSINPCSDTTTMSLASLQHCHSLESLSLLFDPEVLVFGGIVLPSLLVLEIGGLSEEHGLKLIHATASPASQYKLQRLSLVLYHITDAIVQCVSENLPMLLELELRDEPSEAYQNDLTDAGIQKLGALTRLRRLSLVRGSKFFFKRINDVGVFIMIHSLQQLESIRLGGFSRITDASCAAILYSCSKLHTFELMKTSKLTDLAFHNLSSSVPRGLVNVNLSLNNLLSDDTLGHFVCCTTLEVLNLRGCRSIGDAGLRHISKLCNLKTLLLDGSDVSDFGLYPLAKGKMSLISLSLRACTRVTDDGIVALMAGRAAKTLKSLDLSLIPKLTDASILSLVQNGVLPAELWLRNCYQIGDVSVMVLATHLAMHPGRVLKLLDLWNCRKITADALRWFKWPYFSGLRKLGVPVPLEETIRSARPSTLLSFDGSECFDDESGWVDELERRLEKTSNYRVASTS